MLSRIIAARVLGWSTVAAALVAGLSALAGAVEAASLGPMAAAGLALTQVPAALTLLMPILAALGAAVAAARMAALGEELALACGGISPWRTGAAAAGVGLLLGLAQWGCADLVVSHAEAHRRTLLSESDAPWVWLDGAAIHPESRLKIELEDDQISAIRPLVAGEVSEAELARAAMLQQPRTASGAALAGSTLTSAKLEHLSRRVRVVACGLLAWLVWVTGIGHAGTRRIGGALVIAVGWQALDLLLYTAAAQGRLPVLLGGAGAAIVLAAVLLVRFAQSSSRSM
ncbi:MAG: hypothetical protein ACI8RZ_000561 [Myxococcota bacterium]|jgi:hypothetical protein